MKLLSLSQYLQNQSVEETIEVLDDMLYLLVLKTDFLGLSENLVHQYLTIRELRNLFIHLSKEENG
ncbi:MAG: hypothetical protein RIM99_15630 [Cyclobacteriaceae bacterium]